MATSSPLNEDAALLPAWLTHHDDPRHAAQTPKHVDMADWDDGFVPTGCNKKPGKMVRGLPRSNPRAFHVVDGAVSPATADRLYASAVHSKVWGVFVPTTALTFPRATNAASDDENPTREELEGVHEAASTEAAQRYRERLATQAVQEFLVDQANNVITPQDWAFTHGVAVWVIASDCNDETEYHLDYAEQVRYETNVIFPPIYGATLHVSPLRNSTDGATDEANGNNNNNELPRLEGGGFHVNMQGLDHYAKYGYKTRLVQKMTTDTLETTISASEPGWQHVGYQYRRGIVCDGEFPHFSGRVRSLPCVAKPPSAPSDVRLPVKRVVVGFNLFPADIGAFVAKFPEHSRAFNTYVRLSQTAAKTSALFAGGLSLASVRSNPKQAAFLKLLARKVKEHRQQSNQKQEVQQLTNLKEEHQRCACPTSTAAC